jgi:hypothetical protein
MALVGILAGCSTDHYSPFDFKTFPGYTPAGGHSSPPKLTNLPLESDGR